MSLTLTALTTVGAGVLLGARHATDADHVVAIATLVQREPRPAAAARTAVAWGLGHSLTFLGVGAAIIAAGVRVPAGVEVAVELVVAAMLIGLGAMHLAPRTGAIAGAAPAPRRRSFAIGLVHGLAGSGAIALVALTTIASPLGALAYLVAFAAGTTAGMALCTVLLAWPLAWTTRRRGIERLVIAIAGGASVLVGLLIVIEVVAG
ncbi:MAG: high-affinity nickel-transport family protein [Myxococcales bacterium]|nr:high-affinity nickel-transport family protein [Myxococcales bacterium]